MERSDHPLDPLAQLGDVLPHCKKDLRKAAAPAK